MLRALHCNSKWKRLQRNFLSLRLRFKLISFCYCTKIPVWISLLELAHSTLTSMLNWIYKSRLESSLDYLNTGFLVYLWRSKYLMHFSILPDSTRCIKQYIWLFCDHAKKQSLFHRIQPRSWLPSPLPSTSGRMGTGGFWTAALSPVFLNIWASSQYILIPARDPAAAKN